MTNCNCKISPILRDITLQYSDGINVIDLSKYRTILLNPNHLEKLKSCLKEHALLVLLLKLILNSLLHLNKGILPC